MACQRVKPHVVFIDEHTDSSTIEAIGKILSVNEMLPSQHLTTSSAGAKFEMEPSERPF